MEQLVPRIITSVQRNVQLYCEASAEEILDVAYIWTHNGLRIAADDDRRDTRVVSTLNTYISWCFLKKSEL